MDVERLIISRCLAESKLDLVISRNIEAHHFVSRAVGPEPATTDVWAWIVEHRTRYKASPSLDLFRRRWPGFIMLESTDAFDAVLDEFVRVIKRRRLIESLRRLADVADNWNLVGEAEVHMMEEANDLARLVPTTSVTRFSDSMNRLDLYRQREASGGGTPGVSMLVQEIDDFTYGVQDHEVMVIEGFLNIGKSSMGIGMAAKAYFEQDQTPLFITLEMESEKLAQRWDAYAAGISYNAMKRVKLGQGDLDKWERIAEKAAESRFEKDIVLIDDLWHPSIERIYTEVERWRPNFTVVDPIDEINAPSQYRSLYERQGFAIREIKGMARVIKKPFIVMAQSGREAEEEGATLGNIAGSIDIARKADIVVGLHATKDMQKMHKMQFTLLKNRDDEGKGFKTNYYVDTGSMTYRPWTPQDALATQAGPATEP